MRCFFASFAFALSLLFLAAASPAQEWPAARARVVLVLCDALTFDDLRSPAAPHLAHLTETGAIGLMNCAVAGPRTPTSATLTFAIGQQLPAEPTDEQAANDWETVPGERGNAQAVFARRTDLLASTANVGARPAEPRVRHLGLAGLARRGLHTARLGAALQRAKGYYNTFVVGNADTDTPQRRAALLTVSANGKGFGYLAPLRPHAESPFGQADDPVRLAQSALESDADFLVIQFGDTARAEAARPRLSTNAYRSARADALRRLDIFFFLLTEKMPQERRALNVLLVSPYPPPEYARRSTGWGRLTPVLAFGPDFPPGLLTSATTRTLGLIANTDIAPTIFHFLPVPIPSTMVGRPIQVVPYSPDGSVRVAAVARADYVAALNGRATFQVMLPLAAVCAFVILPGNLLALKRGGRAAARRSAPFLIGMLNLPAALLLAPLLVPPTMLEYGLRILAWACVLTVACYAGARFWRVSPPVVAAFLTTLLVIGDTLAGQPLLKDSALSSYTLAGIRYYGVGNEYLGVLLGFALAGGFAWLEERHVPYPPGASAKWARGILALTWLGLGLLLGWPGLGANAGSLITTTAGFGCGAVLLRGGRVTAQMGIGFALLGLALAFGFSALDAVWNREATSHFGAAVQAASGERGGGYLLEIALRKVAMNFRLLTSFWMLVTLPVAVALFGAARALAAEKLREVPAQRPWTAKGSAATLAAGLAALIFKDSGIVTAVLLAGSVCVSRLYDILMLHPVET